MLHKLCLSAKRCKNRWGLSYVGLRRAERGWWEETGVFESNEFGKAARWELEWDNDADKKMKGGRGGRRGGLGGGGVKKIQMNIWRGEPWKKTWNLKVKSSEESRHNGWRLFVFLQHQPNGSSSKHWWLSIEVLWPLPGQPPPSHNVFFAESCKRSRVQIHLNVTIKKMSFKLINEKNLLFKNKLKKINKHTDFTKGVYTSICHAWSDCMLSGCIGDQLFVFVLNISAIFLCPYVSFHLNLN